MIPLGMLGGDQVTSTLVEEAASAMTVRGAEGAVAWEENDFLITFSACFPNIFLTETRMERKTS